MSTQESPEKIVLKSKPAKDFWAKYFGDKDEVKNSEFQQALVSYFAEIDKENKEKREQENKEEEENTETIKDYRFISNPEARRIFAMSMTQQIFWPEGDYRNLYPDKVTKSCLQFAINTFGPWNTIFETIHLNFEDEDQPLAPLQYFHGRTPKGDLAEKLTSFGNFALRYSEESGGGLIMCWARPGKNSYLVTRDEKVKRRKLKKTGVVWTWEERTAGIRGTKTKKHNFNSIGAFINHKKGGGFTMNSNMGIKDPVMFASAYKTFEPDPDDYQDDDDDDDDDDDVEDEKQARIDMVMNSLAFDNE